jgi:NitT/TauT family transport system ATP-binding protein
MLELTDCTARYGSFTVFASVSLTVWDAEVVAVVGPSGCGKTTLLHVAAALRPPAEGSVLLAGRPLARGDRRIGFVQQHYGLFPWFTTFANVELGLKLRHITRQERRRRTAAALSEVGLAARADHFPGELSGGEQQRVALARTNALEPEVLLLDEPFSSLDAFTREALQEDVLRLQAAHRRATLVVTHSLEEAVFLADRIGIMYGTPASIAVTENPWQVPAEERPHRSRTSRAFGEAVSEVRARFEELQHG